MANLFQGLITNEGISYARTTQTVSGWQIKPTRYALAETKGDFVATRTLSTMKTTWYTHAFSDLVKKDTNKILMEIKLTGDETNVSRDIKEIYIICETPDGTEFLYAIVQPLIDTTYVPTVSQDFNFLFTLTNTQKNDVYTIEYIDPAQLDAYQLKVEKGVANGYCPLGSNNIVPDSHLPLSAIKLDILQTIYPVGCIYLTINSSCPLASLFGTWTLVASGKALWTGTGSNGGKTIAESLPDHTHSYTSQSYWGADGSWSHLASWSSGDSTKSGMVGTATFTKASASNSIYSGSHVQPAAYVVNAFRRTA